MKHVAESALRGSVALIRKGDDDDAIGVVTKALSDLQAAIDKRFEGIDLDAVQKRIDDLEIKINRPGAGADDAKAQAEAERKAWVSYLRKGTQTPDIELKVLTVADDARAGYLAPVEVSREFIRELTEISPIRQFASVRQSSAPAVAYPKRTGITNARWEGEVEESEESDVTFGQTEIVSRRLTTFVDISTSLLMGSDGAAEAEVRAAFAEDFAQKEGRAFVLGSGVKEPMGLLTDANVQSVPNGHATNLSADALITLMYSLPAQYRARGVWVLNGATLATIRKLKDGQGNYLWQPSYQAGQPETVLGRPVAEAVDMPNVAADATPILFGDLGAGYRIVDRQQLGTLTDPFTQARRAIVRIHGTTWVGGGVIQPSALRKLRMATS